MSADVAATSYSKSIILRLFALTVAIVLLPIFALSYGALLTFERELVPEMDKKAAAVGRTIAAHVERAVGLGVPFAGLNGMDEYLEPFVKGNPEIRFIAVTDRSGQVIYDEGAARQQIEQAIRSLARRSGAPVAGERSAELAGDFYITELPIGRAAVPLGALFIGVDKKFVQRQIQEILYDVVVVSLVSLLVTFELLLFIVALTITHPINLVQRMLEDGIRGNFSRLVYGAGHNEIGLLARALNNVTNQMNTLYQQISGGVRQAVTTPATEAWQRIRSTYTFASDSAQKIRESNLIFVRTPLFLFVFAEELSRSFFPIYVRELATPISGLSSQFMIGVPISVFMLIAALATPISGVWSDRIGRRPVFLMGAIPAAFGLLMTGLAQGFWDLLLYRSISAAGYGMVFIASQGYVLDNTTRENRAQGIAIYVGAIMAADICGPAIGGIIADRVGFRATFFLAAALTLISSLMVYQILRDDQDERDVRKALAFSDFGLLLKNPRFLVLLIFAAMPAKILLTGFLFYLAPLFLSALDNTQSSIGRIMMGYGIATLALAPLAANLADRTGKNVLFIGLGGLVAGGGLLAVLWRPDSWALVVAIALLGLGQAMSISPQLAMVPQICQREVEKIGLTTTVSVYRVVERLGGVVGPFLVGSLLSFGSYSYAMTVTGLLMMGCAAIFLAVFTFWPAKGTQ